MAYYCGGELYHYGVMGMHWGIRRYQPYPAGHTGGKEVGQAARAKKKKYVYPSADINSMSNDQLRRKVNRMNLESRYADMSTQKYVAERKAQKAANNASSKLNKFDDKKAKTTLAVTKNIPEKIRKVSKNDFVEKHVSDKNRKKLIDTSKKIDSIRNEAYRNLELNKKRNKNDNPNKRLSEAVRTVGKGVEGANDLTKSVQRINRVDYRNEKMYEATKMSYKDLQEKVNRMDMERQYSELKDSAYTTKGKQVLEELIPILFASGAIVGGAKTVATATGAKKSAEYAYDFYKQWH